MIFAALANWLIARAKRTPYFHLHHADGTLYMERYWLVPYTGGGSHSDQGCYTAKWFRKPVVWLLQRFRIAVRAHHICSPDADQDSHDHPWPFASVVLRGFYMEYANLSDWGAWVFRFRKQGSISFSPITFRHRIVNISYGGVWTLLITFRNRQDWGFFTSRGKVLWRDYLRKGKS